MKKLKPENHTKKGGGEKKKDKKRKKPAEVHKANIYISLEIYYNLTIKMIYI